MKVLSFLIVLMSAFSANAQWKAVKRIGAFNSGGLYAKSNSECIVGSMNGVFFRTTDTAQSWDSTVQKSPAGWIHDIDFPTNSIGYASGGTAFGMSQSPVFKTTDSGASWDTIVTNRFGYELYSLSFANKDTGLIGGQGRIISTTDGGATFSVKNLVSLNVNKVESVASTDNAFFFCADTRVFKTTDLGNNWTVVHNHSSAYVSHLKSINFLDNNRGYIVGDSLFWTTTDGGDNWTYGGVISGQHQFFDIQFLTPDTGYVVGRTSAGSVIPMKGVVYKTTDGGLNWTKDLEIDNQEFIKISMTSADEGYVISWGGVYTIQGRPVSLNEVKKKEVIFYPNPASSHIVLKLPERISQDVSIYNVFGQLVKKEKITSQASEMELSSLSPGSYYLKVEGVASPLIIVD